MARLWLPRGSRVAAVMVTLVVLSPPVALSWDARPRFLQQLKGECLYINGTERLRQVTRYVYNREEFLRFDSDVGLFRATTELGRPIARDLNGQKDVLDSSRAALDRCRNNHPLVLLLAERRVEPRVTVYPTKTEPPGHHSLLVCAVSGFYPGRIDVRWFRDGHEEEKGVLSTGLIGNGDWTFQTLVMLETVPQSGEVYTCRVEHPSRPRPIAVEWRDVPGWPSKDDPCVTCLQLAGVGGLLPRTSNQLPPSCKTTQVASPNRIVLSNRDEATSLVLQNGAQSASAQGKMLSGVLVSVLGLLFLGAGLFVYFRNLPGHPGLPPTGLLS